MNFMIPGPAYFVLDILIKVTAFDYLPMTSIVDLGYHKTDPWNPRFSWLGY